MSPLSKKCEDITYEYFNNTANDVQLKPCKDVCSFNEKVNEFCSNNCKEFVSQCMTDERFTATISTNPMTDEKFTATISTNSMIAVIVVAAVVVVVAVCIAVRILLTRRRMRKKQGGNAEPISNSSSTSSSSMSGNQQLVFQQENRPFFAHRTEPDGGVVSSSSETAVKSVSSPNFCGACRNENPNCSICHLIHTGYDLQSCA